MLDELRDGYESLISLMVMVIAVAKAIVLPSVSTIPVNMVNWMNVVKMIWKVVFV